MAKGIMYVNGQRIPFDGEPNVLSVIRKAGIEMPTFCYYSDLSVYGACRMCVVEDERGKIDTSCSMPPRDGMQIRTNTARLLKHRRMILELMLASHNCNCTTCEKSGNCHLQELALQFGVSRVRFQDSREESVLDDSGFAVVRDPSKCILCGDCVRVCEESIGMGIIDFAHRGYNMRVQPAFNRTLGETKCISCGQCSAVCPTGAITVRNEIGAAWRAIHSPDKRVVVQIAPAVRVAVGEAFGLPAGTNVMDQLVTALKYMGVDEVYDTTFGADLTTIEESEEFLARVKAGGPFPMFTSCCPAWVKYLENENPKYLRNISSCKSPMQMFAALIKAKQDPEDTRETVHIAIMPCTAKKMEAERPNSYTYGEKDTDAVITTTELVQMIKQFGLDFANLDGESCDMPFGMGSGGGVIFGVTGGVTEAVLRRLLKDHSPKSLEAVAASGVRGNDGIKELTVPYNGIDVKICVASGLANARKVMNAVKSGEKEYHLIEVMACPGGCVMGGGQPTRLDHKSVIEQRDKGIYDTDKRMVLKKSNENPLMDYFYQDEIFKHKIHDLLHNHK